MGEKKLQLVSNILNSRNIANDEYYNQKENTIATETISTPAKPKTVSSNQQFFTPRTHRVSTSFCFWYHLRIRISLQL